MSPKTPRDTQATDAGSTPREPELVLPVGPMNAAQRQALEVAEAARDHEENRPSFAGALFHGRFLVDLLEPLAGQDPEDRLIGDQMVQDVCAFMAEHLDPDEVDETRTIPESVIDGLRALGVLRMKIPREYGGLGFSQVNYNRVMQAMASYCGSTTVLVSAHQSIGVPQPLKMFGSDTQKARFYPALADGAISAFALTEPGVGSDPARMTTTAVPTEDGRHYIINGEKLWTTNGPIADLLVVMAQTPPKVRRGREKRQISAFIVDTRTAGIEVSHRCDFMGLRGIQNGVIRFTDVRVPADHLLVHEGFGLKLALHTLNTGRLTLPAACTGMAKQCLAIAREWGEERTQWGLPVGRHEAGREKIADIAATTLAMEAVTAVTSQWCDEGRNIRIEAAMAKLFCSEAAWRLIDTTMQLRGGRGYERAASLRGRGEADYPVERMMRDCRINRIIEGTTDIMHLFLAREALDPHLTRATTVLRPGLSPTRRAIAGAMMAGHYAWWYPRQIVGRRITRRYRSHGTLAKHARFIDRTASRLAGALFRAMALNGPKLERRQVLLGLLVEIGTELFAMAATCAHARALKAHGGHDNAEALADLFCRHARNRIEGHFRALRRRAWRHDRTPTDAVLDGQYRWLEDGVLSCATDGLDMASRSSRNGTPQNGTTTNGTNGSARTTRRRRSRT